MAKYIKLEDAIEAYNQAVTLLVESEMEEFNLGDFTECSFNTTQIKLIARMIESLPTIEVSEDCISREYMLKLPEELKGWMPNDKNQELWEKIKNAPSVVPTTEQSSVVRCKDCKHYHASKHYAYCTVINVKGKHPQPNDYCSYAEEK